MIGLFLPPLSPVDEASQFVGTAGHGHAYPGATAPFGMVQLSPDTRTGTWDGSSGYHYSDRRILAFSHTHFTGTGIGGLGDVAVMPFVGTPAEGADLSSVFDHDRESASPGRYAVRLDGPNVFAELAATPRVGLHRYRYDGSGDRWLALDLVHGISNETRETFLKRVDATTFVGFRKSSGWGGDRTVFFALRLSAPVTNLKVFGGEERVPGEYRGRLRAFLAVPPEVVVRVAISATGIDGARRNLEAEAPTDDFDAVRARTRSEWERTFARTRFESPDPRLRRTFYSNLYLSSLAPTLFSDVDGAYLGHDAKVHRDPPHVQYSTFSLWDTYRAVHPLLTLTEPERVGDMAASLVAMASEREIATTPIWPFWGNETYVMVGVHSVAVIAEAYLKGHRNFDAERAYGLLRRAMTNDRNGLGDYGRLGWVASRRGMEATSKTIEYAYDDWCLARMAEAMGKRDDAEFFFRRSAQYRNLWDGTTRLFRGRLADGSWRRPFDPLGLVGDEYTESTAWQYLFAVQHDVPGMIALQGGDRAFVRRLDGLFTMTDEIRSGIPDISGLIGQYAHGNEPCHHVASLYAYAGAPAKGAARIREVMRRFYSDAPDGQIGNVDCGQMSAWYVWQAAGLYPVNPASGTYVIGSPVGERTTFSLPGGKRFAVVARNAGAKNVYVRSASLDGQPYDRSWISHDRILRGGTLVLDMGPTPTRWATSPLSRPPATMPTGFRYEPLPAPADPRPIPLTLPILIACGADEPVGPFIPDPNAEEGATNATGGRVDVSVPFAAPEAVYRSERYGPDFAQRFRVPPGRYDVRLHFAEVFGSRPGDRIQDVWIGGRKVMSRFEPVVAAGGPMRAVVRTFADVSPDRSGTIVVRVRAASGTRDRNAKISAIEILPRA